MNKRMKFGALIIDINKYLIGGIIE